MANSDWANEAFGPLHDVGETRSAKDRVDAVADLFRADFDVQELHEELELTDGCEQCFAWVFGSGLQCDVHGEEATQRKGWFSPPEG